MGSVTARRELASDPRRAVLDAIYQRGAGKERRPVRMLEIMEDTSLARDSVESIVDKLCDDALVARTSDGGVRITHSGMRWLEPVAPTGVLGAAGADAPVTHLLSTAPTGADTPDTSGPRPVARNGDDETVTVSPRRLATSDDIRTALENAREVGTTVTITVARSAGHLTSSWTIEGVVRELFIGVGGRWHVRVWIEPDSDQVVAMDRVVLVSTSR